MLARPGTAELTVTFKSIEYYRGRHVSAADGLAVVKNSDLRFLVSTYYKAVPQINGSIGFTMLLKVIFTSFQGFQPPESP